MHLKSFQMYARRREKQVECNRPVRINEETGLAISRSKLAESDKKKSILYTDVARSFEVRTRTSAVYTGHIRRFIKKNAFRITLAD